MQNDFFIAYRHDADNIALDFDRRPDFSTGNAENSVLAGLISALGFADTAKKLAGDEYLVAMRSDEGPWVFDLPDELTNGLAELQSENAADLADRWAASQELSYHGVTGADMLPAMNTLKSLAEKARGSEQRLLLRMAM